MTGGSGVSVTRIGDTFIVSSTIQPHDLDGLQLKPSARVASVSNIDLAAGGLITVDGIALSGNDRVLVRAQTDPVENGVYLAKTGSWVRAEDLDEDDEVVAGVIIVVEEGATYEDTLWLLSSDNAISVGVDPIEFKQAGGATAASDLSDVDTAGAVDGSLLRFEDSAGEWQATTSVLVTDDGQVRVGVDPVDGDDLARKSYVDANDVSEASDLSDVDTVGAVDGSLLRFEDSAGEWQATTSVLVTDSGQVRVGVDPAHADDLARKAYVDANDVGVISDLGDADTSDLPPGPDADGRLLRYDHSAGIWKADTGVQVTPVISMSNMTGGVNAGNLRASARSFLSGLRIATADKTSTYTVDTNTDHTIIADSSGGPITINLPVSSSAGDEFVVYRRGPNTVTISQGASSNTIEGATTHVLRSDGDSVKLKRDETTTAWRIVSDRMVAPKRAAGLVNAPTSVGTQAVTGLGFKPSVVRFVFGATSGVVAHTTNGVALVDAGGVLRQHLHASRSNFTDQAFSGQSGSHCVGNLNATGGWARRASLASFDADGFTLNWDVVDAASIVFRWEAEQ